MKTIYHLPIGLFNMPLPPIEPKTFRQFAEDSAKLAIKSALNCSDEQLDDVLGILAKVPGLREEGAKIWPNIIITDRIEEINKQIPNSSILRMGKLPRSPGIMAKAFKSLSPLCELPWCGWINTSPESIEFGMISSEDNQLSLSVLSNLDASPDDWPCNTLYAFPESDTVLVIRSKSRTLHLSFSLLEYRPTDRDPIKAISSAVSNQITDDTLKPIIQSYIAKVIAHSIAKSHGCILAVINNEKIAQWKSTHPEACWLSEDINIAAEVRAHLEAKGLQGKEFMLLDNRLRLIAEAISSMIRQDGISIFSNDGRMLCYRLFVKSIDSDGTGGARTKAFQKLASADGVIKALFRSQDGHTKLSPE